MPARSRSDSGPKTFNWTKIHLIYFALAAVDVTAIGAGLWLSNWTNSSFQHSIASAEGGLLMHHHANTLLEATAELSAPINDLFVHGDPQRAKQELDTAAAVFRTATLEQNSTKDIDSVAGDGVAIDQALKTRDAKSLASTLGLSMQVVEEFETLQVEIRKSGEEMISLSNSGINQMLSGNSRQAGETMGTVDGIMRRQQAAIGKILDLADDHVKQAIQTGGSHSNLAARFQSWIGGTILVIIALVLCYGHFVGRLLRRKYALIEASNARALEQAEEIGIINEGVIKLNAELSETLKKLSGAQEENLRRGKLAQLGQLTATVAHELRNPLGAVKTSAFLVERKLKGKGLGIEPQLQRINSGVSRCDNIISQLLDFARTRSIQAEQIELDDWLAKFVEDESQNLPASVSVDCDLGLAGVTAAFDPGRMSRVLINLMSNASEAMVGKGVDPAKFAVKEPRISIASSATARGFEISVADNGPGIAPENLDRVFEPLFTTKSFGTGLGIPAVQKIMEQHGGGLEVRSAPGQGAEFIAWWPRELPVQVAA